MQRSCQETSCRSCTETLDRDLWRRSCQGVSYRDLAWRSPLDTLYRHPFTGMLCSFYKDPVTEILHAIFYRDLGKGNLQNLPCFFCVRFLAALFGVFCRDIFEGCFHDGAVYFSNLWYCQRAIKMKGNHIICYVQFVEGLVRSMAVGKTGGRWPLPL